ncbi:MAG: OadG family protein [Lachnospiraceae bacterium]
MKMKRIAFVFSMIAMFCVLTACSSGKEELDFVYSDVNIIANTIANADQMQNATSSQRAYWENSDDESASIYLTGVNNFDSAKDECGDFLGYRSKNNDILTIDYTSISQMDEDAFNEWYANLISNVDATITENGANVTVELVAAYETRDVIYSFVYEKNPEADYAAEIYQQNVLPYQVKEILATPDYTFGEKMSKAGANTLMGMGTVFVVLIFISLVIAQFERINKMSTKIANWWVNRKSKNNEVSQEQDVTSPATSIVERMPAGVTATQNPMDDSELVAVITAAVVASSVSTGGTDQLVVRSIRKARR